MLGGIEYVHWELQEYGSLKENGHPGIQLWWERDEDTRPVEVPLIPVPVGALLVALLRAGPLRERQARDEHEKHGEEYWAQDRRIQGVISLPSDEPIRCR